MNDLADRIQRRLQQKGVTITFDEAKDIETCFKLMYITLTEEYIQECLQKAHKQKNKTFFPLSTKASPCYFRCQTQIKEFHLTLKFGETYDIMATVYWDLKKYPYTFSKGQTGCVAEPIE